MIKTGQSKERGALIEYSENSKGIQLLGRCAVPLPHLSATTMGNGMMNKGRGGVFRLDVLSNKRTRGR